MKRDAPASQPARQPASQPANGGSDFMQRCQCTECVDLDARHPREGFQLNMFPWVATGSVPAVNSPLDPPRQQGRKISTNRAGGLR